MKVKKYIGILIATMLLAGFTACGGSDSNDPLNPENPDKPKPEPELPADYNPIVGEWISEFNTNIKHIFTKDFEWKKSYRKNPNENWSEPIRYRSYEMIRKDAFETSDLIWRFTITQEYPKEILTLTVGGEPLRFYRVIH